MTLRHALAAATVSLLAACGGGSDDPAPAAAAPVQPQATAAAAVSRVVVAGDSLADVGTFGYKATVQNAADRAAGYPVYPQLVARQYGIGAQCNHFASSNEGQSFTTNPACTNFAVASALIANPVTRRGDDSPFSIRHQLRTALAASGGAWQAGDLVVIDAGANDAAALADAYLDAQAGGADQAVFLALLGQQLSGSTIAQALSQADGGSVAARLYMQQLARTYWNDVRGQLLDRGARRVALVDVPDLTRTPRFRSITAGVAATRGATAAADFEAALRSWIVAFNTELARLTAGDTRVAIAPYFDDFTAQNTTPAAFGLTDANEAACPLQGDFPDCTDAALDAAPPAGRTAGWWRTWLYSDRFHPSPRGHELLAATVLRTLERANWR